MVELIAVKDFKRAVFIEQNINIEIDEVEDAVGKGRRHVDIAVEVSKSTIRFVKSKHVKPARKPVILVRYCPAQDFSKIRVGHVVFKNTPEQEFVPGC